MSVAANVHPPSTNFTTTTITQNPDHLRKLATRLMKTKVAIGAATPLTRVRSDSTRRSAAFLELDRIVEWYLATAYRKWEGPGVLPFFADPKRVGRFAIDLQRLESRDAATLFRLLIALSMFQSRRDVDIMTIQREMPPRDVAAMSSTRRLRVLLETARCEALQTAERFEQTCDVRRDLEQGVTTCGHRPRTECHVKDATRAIGRMGDMGKLATSAWLRLGPTGLTRWFDETCVEEPSAIIRAARLVDRLSSIYRIGRKLASMYVSVLSVRELTGTAPWLPEVDGSQLVVVDGNVASAISLLRGPRGSQSYDAMSRWFTRLASQIKLATKQRGLPQTSPRFIQQAVYMFRSRSNRAAAGDPCERHPCESCPSRVCPFKTRVNQ